MKLSQKREIEYLGYILKNLRDDFDKTDDVVIKLFLRYADLKNGAKTVKTNET